ncbi:hypothetical protein B0H16DRAFT_1467740 [Mycena metata]|uniref:Uncharacterized protein n=1 Tax=Mycena metata TaxID=1033252 RepID=A0AAD7MVP4_9AGAR|nr:hypothetical protein B0H16DRAFT_1467740 [Mycena metata]
MPMKDDPSSTRGAADPISAAAQGLAQAMAEAQRAIAAAQSQQSNASSALGQSQRECKRLQVRVVELKELAAHQIDTIDTLRKRSDELATERDIHREHAQAREGRIAMLQQRIATVESSRMRERHLIQEERLELEALREEVKAGKAALKTERGRLTREQNKLLQDKRAARNMVAGLKRSVDAMDSQLGDDTMDKSEDEDEKESAASPRKRRKMDDAAEDQKASREYPRRGRRATNWG